ncbi:hypothetical protein MA16_Dca016390 [Dendrobium catenatum]|uniref:Uncharacterized protein n=1 Tax=Dendrobium catenatum TaxID=906689 RepID=A0A2I0W369_9ASPA|nr:hypothetical protein MA16_Dca016390 [Dendrobium catenatum]
MAAQLAMVLPGMASPFSSYLGALSEKPFLVGWPLCSFLPAAAGPSFLLKRGPNYRSKKRRKKLILDHRLSFAGPSLEALTFAGPPSDIVAPPDYHLRP